MAISNVRPGAPVTLRDVARVAGVHPATVSRALNEETRALVNEETARRVLKAAEELGYQPNPIARGLKTNRSYTIGVLIPDLTNPLFPPILRGIEDRLETAGYTPLTANTDNDPEAELPVSSATADDGMGMRLAVEHLVSLRHTRIAHLAGPLDYSTGLDRYDSFHETMRAAGIEPDPELVVVAEAFTEAEGRRLCAQLMAAGRDFTAVAAANDLLALGCYDVFAERGVRCPDEISVVGFNDMPFAARFQPPLTTIHIPHYAIGQAAAELMLERLRDGDSPPREIRLEPSLIVRGSTAPPPD